VGFSKISPVTEKELKLVFSVFPKIRAILFDQSVALERKFRATLFLFFWLFTALPHFLIVKPSNLAYTVFFAITANLLLATSFFDLSLLLLLLVLWELLLGSFIFGLLFDFSNDFRKTFFFLFQDIFLNEENMHGYIFAAFGNAWYASLKRALPVIAPIVAIDLNEAFIRHEAFSTVVAHDPNHLLDGKARVMLDLEIRDNLRKNSGLYVAKDLTFETLKKLFK